jgi:hypothetical protein
MRENTEKATKLLNDVRQVQEAAWKTCRRRRRRRSRALQKAWAEALGRFG